MTREWKFELQSTMFVLLLIMLIIVPIWNILGLKFTFYVENVICMLIFLSFTKYIFLLKFTPFARKKWLKFFFVFFCIPIFLFLINSLFDFQRFLDEEGMASLFIGSQNLDNYNFGRFVRYQFLFFNVGALVATIMMPFRLIISFWRIRNTIDRV